MLAFSATSRAMIHVETCCQSSALPTELLGHFKQKPQYVSTRILAPAARLAPFLTCPQEAMLAFSATSRAMIHVEPCCQSSALPTELLGHFKQKPQYVSTRILAPAVRLAPFLTCPQKVMLAFSATSLAMRRRSMLSVLCSTD
ncbi:hypothetical protein C8R31_1038 [Nitrosospira sp. Nsp2]|nr:hypothetical protein C8R31_1038 [Nitrosospira sp. Nsp2]